MSQENCDIHNTDATNGCEKCRVEWKRDLLEALMDKLTTPPNLSALMSVTDHALEQFAHIHGLDPDDYWPTLPNLVYAGKGEDQLLPKRCRVHVPPGFQLYVNGVANPPGFQLYVNGVAMENGSTAQMGDVITMQGKKAMNMKIKETLEYEIFVDLLTKLTLSNRDCKADEISVQLYEFADERSTAAAVGDKKIEVRIPRSTLSAALQKLGFAITLALVLVACGGAPFEPELFQETGGAAGASTGGQAGASSTGGAAGVPSGGGSGGVPSGGGSAGTVQDAGMDADAGCTNVDDGNACTVDVCDTHTVVEIDDANACTIDSCNPSTGVAHELDEFWICTSCPAGYHAVDSIQDCTCAEWCSVASKKKCVPEGCAG